MDSSQREIFHCTTLSLIRPTRNSLGLKLGLRIERPATYASVLARPEEDIKLFKYSLIVYFPDSTNYHG